MQRLSGIAVKIQWASPKKTPPDWNDIRHTTAIHSLYWVRSGTGKFVSDQGSYTAESSSLFYLKPGLNMTMAARGGRGLDMFMILFDAAHLSGSDGRWPDPSPVATLELPHRSAFSGETAVEIDALFSRIAALWSNGVPTGELEASGVLLSLIARLHADLAPEKEKARSL
ncbi:AraC family ligand binding domain-containing protein, partial [Saccharibacillus alkalitolerans]